MTLNNQNQNPVQSQSKVNPFMLIVEKSKHQQQSSLFHQPFQNHQTQNSFFSQPTQTSNPFQAQPQQPEISFLNQFQMQVSTPDQRINMSQANFMNAAAQAAQNINSFANNQASVQNTTSNAFNSNMSFVISNNQAPSQQATQLFALNSSVNQFFPKTDTSNISNAYYSNVSDLSKEEIEEYKQNAFKIGQIPYNPPAKEFC